MDEAFDVWEAPKLLKDAYDQHFAENWRKDLAAMVRRDRIHPSIVFWSIGNEISEAVTPRGVELAGQMCEVIREHDRSRFITHALTATHSGAAGEGARAPLDTISYNYSFDAVDRDHRAYPSLTFMTTETHAADAYVVKQLMDRNPAYMGEFLWTGLDYIGEVGSGSSRLRSDTAQPDAKPKMIFGMDVSHLNFYVWDYPAYQSGSGEIDLIGLKKPPSYFRDVVWGRSDLELFVQRPTPAGYHEEQTAWGWPDELMSWTWPHYPDETMTVRVVTRGDEVLLMLNGAEIGRKRLGPEDKRIAVFKTPYRAGTLTAVAFVEGQEIARKTLESAGAPVQLRLRAERSTIAGSANDLAYVFVEVCDAQGRLVPDASVPVTFSSSKGLTLLAAGSANPYGIESFQDADTRTFHGTALAILQPSGVSRRGNDQRLKRRIGERVNDDSIVARRLTYLTPACCVVTSCQSKAQLNESLNMLEEVIRTISACGRDRRISHGNSHSDQRRYSGRWLGCACVQGGRSGWAGQNCRDRHRSVCVTRRAGHRRQRMLRHAGSD